MSTTVRSRKSSRETLKKKRVLTRTSSISKRKHITRRLHHFHELPEWQQDNDKILTGYVRETNSFTKCIESLFYFNNESVNIYTHLVPALIYLALPLLLLIDTYLVPKFPTTTAIDYVK